MVRLLKEQGGAELMKPKKDGMTVLHIAASHNDIHTIDYAMKTIENP